MDGRRRLQPPRSTAFAQVSEPELDMPRKLRVRNRAFARLAEMIRGLISDRHIVVAPMRSIARELEESWPTGEG
jgi:hypothetical protein